KLGNDQPSGVAQGTPELGKTGRATELSPAACDDPTESDAAEPATAGRGAIERSDQRAAESAAGDSPAASEPAPADRTSEKSAAAASQPRTGASDPSGSPAS